MAAAPKLFPARYPAVFFVGFMCMAMGLFLLAFYWWIPDSTIFAAYLHLNAEIAAGVLSLLGERASATGTILSTPEFSLQIKHGCDALPSMAFLVVATLATPIRMSIVKRLVPIAIGVLTLQVLNIGRILSLYYVGLQAPGAFEWVHIDLWQAVFVFAPLILWLLWLRNRLPALGRCP